MYDSRADVWSIGITAIELADGLAPFHDSHPTRTLFQIVHNPPPLLSVPSSRTVIFNDFIAECLEKNPEHRPFMVEIIEHPLFENLPDNDYYVSIARTTNGLTLATSGRSDFSCFYKHNTYPQFIVLARMHFCFTRSFLF